MSQSYSIVREDQFIEATRDSGYKGTDSALSELIDNSLQAKATSVSIRLSSEEQEQNGRGRPKQPRVVDLVIADNGRGMDKTTLRRSLRFGDGSRFGDRAGLGRFGMGLPNASVSQCTRVEVYSWQRNAMPLFTYIDVKEIAASQLSEVPEPWHEDIPADLKDLATSASGTIIIWRNCDRIDHDGRVDTLIRTLRHSLGRMFRYFLITDFHLTINDIEIAPFDPSYLMPESRIDDEPLATQHGDRIAIEIPIPGMVDQTSTVEVSFTLLPEHWQTTFNKDSKARSSRYIDSTAGFSMVRHGREVDLIRSPFHAKHWTDSWYRVEVRFEPELDEVFGVTHTKQHARIVNGTPIFERLKNVILPNVNTMKAMIVARGKKSHKARADRAEIAANNVLPRLKPLEDLAQKPEAVSAQEISDYVESQRAKGLPDEMIADLEQRLTDFQLLVEMESLPGAPFYRSKIVGSSIIVLLNTDHLFYDRIFKRLENESPVAKTGVELLLMTLARAEVLASPECRDWYEDQRQEWSQHMKVFLGQLDEVDPTEDTSDNRIDA